MAVVVELPEYRIILIEATLLKKFVNAFQIVERVVDEELQFWYDAQLMAQAASQFVTDGTHIAVEQRFHICQQRVFPVGNDVFAVHILTAQHIAYA